MLVKKYVELFAKDTQPKSAKKLFAEVEKTDNDEKYLSMRKKMSEKLDKKEPKQKRGRPKKKQPDNEEEDREPEKNADENERKQIENDVNNLVADIVDKLGEESDATNAEPAEEGVENVDELADHSQAKIAEENDVEGKNVGERENRNSPDAEPVEEGVEIPIVNALAVNYSKAKIDKEDDVGGKIIDSEDQDDAYIDLTGYEIRWGCPYHGCSFTVGEKHKSKLKAHYDSVKGRTPKCKHRRRYDGMTVDGNWWPSQRNPTKILKPADQKSKKK